MSFVINNIQKYFRILIFYCYNLKKTIKTIQFRLDCNKSYFLYWFVYAKIIKHIFLVCKMVDHFDVKFLYLNKNIIAVKSAL